MALTQEQQDQLDAAIARRLIGHLDSRKDVQNIDLMILAGFCRNCLSKWYRTAADEQGIDISDNEAREHIYGMPYGEWKQKYQRQVTPEQLARFDARKNA